MLYKIKYSNELKHHGVLGMKWGVWNDETAARYRGEKRRPSIDAKSSKVLYESTNRYDLKRDSGTYKGKQINTVHIKNKDNGKEIEITEESLANLIQNGQDAIFDVLQEEGDFTYDDIMFSFETKPKQIARYNSVFDNYMNLTFDKLFY